MTTPQNVALADVIKGVEMFNKVHVPVSYVSNNSYDDVLHYIYISIY